MNGQQGLFRQQGFCKGFSGRLSAVFLAGVLGDPVDVHASETTIRLERADLEAACQYTSCSVWLGHKHQKRPWQR